MTDEQKQKHEERLTGGSGDATPAPEGGWPAYAGRLAGDLELLREELNLLRAAARAAAESMRPGVSQADAEQIMFRLAELVGVECPKREDYGLGPAHAKETERFGKELTRLADWLSKEVELLSPGWTFSLFCYEIREDPSAGHVLHVAHDRNRSALAVTHWLGMVMRRPRAQG